MKRLILAVATVFALTIPTFGSSLHSGFFPSPPWCPTCFVASYMDTHAPGSTIDATSVIWGWGSLCAIGEVPNQITAWANTPSGQVAIPLGYVQHIPRPDVDAHLQASGCASNPNAGFVVYFWDQAFPAGTSSVGLAFHRQGIYAWHMYRVQQ